MDAPKRVLLYGLSANPPAGRGGHQGIVQHFSNEFDELWVLPVYKHIYQTKQELAPFEDRMRMCEIAFVENSIVNTRGNVRVLDIEKTVVLDALHQAEALGQPPEQVRVGTIDVVEKLRETYPHCHFSILLGGDTYSDLMAGKWKRGDDLIAQADIVVVRRVGVDLPQVPAGRNFSIRKLDFLTDCSSTKIRSMSDEESMSPLLDPRVLAYMKEKKLYAFATTSTE